ncbi:dihydroneopterin aldolase [Loigolactobacillus coryniformis subsp. coryniformis]|uniref:7,8-dihydroneopterin aldolase n=2 Tax=Loigolactobacillus coryniformis subsp. coryniformis TaxID=115541 RepID=J3JBK4_9LACO|nr:dihydroneopterin aldolase [Loigolactobacillus coryniformis]ATO55870.1 dihydroneopterin aldolase [Loigolactobacillus coryniformis subsp. coryniformis KCTC 3167 = DSM 20001]EJN55804.1 Dihydroneopterin aldolase [Loigolactobacillus coryniformis subsp. coryniformis CECT 5711]KRK17699.1 dihydroneopterin aldolase [Loigolactobacillus coryniformis subsp. coryniformis KCTC 3167 = DSM 20001]OEH89570.1 dihydroneopterin aldolase [Loigolactobacillus coryniformis subsp. coryniformis]
MGLIKINNIQVYTYNGVLPEENRLGQRLEIDVALTVPIERLGTKDQLNETVNYAKVYDSIVTIAQTQQYQLIESLANHISQELLRQYQLVEAVQLRVRKYSVPIAGIFDNVEIEVQVKR